MVALDVAGLFLKDAIQLLKENGYSAVQIDITAAPREKNRIPHDFSRVVRVVYITENTVKVLVCNI